MTLLDFVPTGLLRAGVMSTARHVATAAGTFTFAWLMAHHAPNSDAKAISEEIASLIVPLASWGFSLWDNSNVQKIVVTAAATGTVTAADDPKIRADTMAAIKSGSLPMPTTPAPNIEDIVAARQAAARGV